MELVFQVRDDDIHMTGRRIAYKMAVAVEKEIKCSSLGHVKSEMFVRYQMEIYI